MHPRQSILHASHKIALDRLSSSTQPIYRPPLQAQTEHQHLPPPPPYTPRPTPSPPSPPAPFAHGMPLFSGPASGGNIPTSHSPGADAWYFPRPTANGASTALRQGDLVDDFSDDEDDVSDEDDERGPRTADAHEIHIDASTLITGTGNVIQSDASGLGARIASHLITLLREYDAATVRASAPTPCLVPTTSASAVPGSDACPPQATGAAPTDGQSGSGPPGTAQSGPAEASNDVKPRGRPVHVTLDVRTKIRGERNVLGGLGTRMRLAPVGTAPSTPDSGSRPAAPQTAAGGSGDDHEDALPPAAATGAVAAAAAAARTTTMMTTTEEQESGARAGVKRSANDAGRPEVKRARSE